MKPIFSIAFSLAAMFFLNCAPGKLVPAQGDNIEHTEQVDAFPGAEGFGRYTTGGRGGKVLIVDNLTDDEKNPQPGSLRWAIAQKGPRIIVFNVSGTIALEGPLKISEDNLTIAGQTAPGDGICLKNFATSVQANNVIIRYLRFRCGNEKLASAEQDALNGTRHRNIIIDHCSMSWSIDETASFYDNTNFTLQWSIISESLYNAGHAKGPHGFGGIWGGMGASFHHNLISSHTSRNPRFNGSRFTSDSATEIVDFRNNVVFNWGFNSAYGGEEGKQNMVNNYFKAGPATKKGDVQYRILDLTQLFFMQSINPDTLYAGRFYIDGNVVEGNSQASKDNWGVGVQKATANQKLKSKSSIPFPFGEVATESAEKAYQHVLDNVGAVFPKRDAVDQRIVYEVKTGTCKYGGQYGAGSGIIDSQNQTGGWPELKTYNTLQDTDRDGMPDNWEKSKGLNPNDPADAATSTLHRHYSNIEVYINTLVR